MLLVQLRFQSVVCPSLPFSQPPTLPPNPVLPNPLSIFGRPLFLGKGPLFLWKGCSFRVRLDPGGAAGCSRWLAGLAGAPGCFTCQVGSRKDSSHLVCAFLPPCGGGRPQQSLPDRPSQDAVASLEVQCPWATWYTCPISKGGFLVVTQWC